MCIGACSGDTFTVCMESITSLVDGPLAFLAAYAFLADRSYRHTAQLVLSLLQLYGDTLYFITAWKVSYYSFNVRCFRTYAGQAFSP